MPSSHSEETFPCGCVVVEIRERFEERAFVARACNDPFHVAIREGAAFARSDARRAGEWRGRADPEPFETPSVRRLLG